MTSSDLEQSSGGPIQARHVSEDDCKPLMERHFGPLKNVVIVDVYWQMRETCIDYSGGSWQFYELSNGGFYMAPISDTRFRVHIQETAFDGSLTADAVGIVACLTALSVLALGGNSQEVIATHLGALRAFAAEHVECTMIFAAIGEACPQRTPGTLITPDWMRRYAEGEDECPSCGGSLEGREITIEEDQASQEVNCTECGYSFSAIYGFKGVVPDDPKENNGEAIYLDGRK